MEGFNSKETWRRRPSQEMLFGFCQLQIAGSKIKLDNLGASCWLWERKHTTECQSTSEKSEWTESCPLCRLMSNPSLAVLVHNTFCDFCANTHTAELEDVSKHPALIEGEWLEAGRWNSPPLSIPATLPSPCPAHRVAVWVPPGVSG